MIWIILVNAIYNFVVELFAEHSCYTFVCKHFCRLAGWHGCFFFIETEIKMRTIIHIINIIFITQEINQLPTIDAIFYIEDMVIPPRTDVKKC